MAHRAPGRCRRGGVSPVQLSVTFPHDRAFGGWFTERRCTEGLRCGTVRIQSGAAHTTVPCRCRGRECRRRFSVRTVSLGTMVYNSQKIWLLNGKNMVVATAVIRRTLRFDTPEQELSERVSLHQAVEQPADLILAPHEFPLDRWQHIFVRNDPVQCLAGGSALLVHSLSLVGASP